MSYTQLLKERDSIAATPIYPAGNNGTQYTGTIDMSRFNRAQFFVIAGALQGATLQAYLGESTVAAGTSNTNITGGAITNMSTNSCMATLECSSSVMTKRYLMCTVILSGGSNANNQIACFGIGTEGHYPPVNNNDSVTVTQRLSVG